jgi:FMN-dependent NADH-azoreductase
MRTLLHIDSSPRTERSCSRQLTAQFASAWRVANPGGMVVHRDLGLSPVPMISEDWIGAAFSDPAVHTTGQQSAIAISNQLVDELIAADEVVIGAPMYNFGVSASLKAWIDQIVRVGRTVSYPSFTGLLQGRKVTIISTRGGVGLRPGEAMADYDCQVPYLIQILGFLGITDVPVVYADSLANPDAARETSLARAREEVERLTSQAGR